MIMGLSGRRISKGNHGKQVVHDLREEHISFKKLYVFLPYQHLSALPSVYPSLCHPICTQLSHFGSARCPAAFSNVAISFH